MSPFQLTPPAMLTLEIINKEVEKIRERARDYESAHGMEDNLHQTVLQAIAAGECDDPPAFAAAALKTAEIDFPRYCA